jgi:hypothetical protein
MRTNLCLFLSFARPGRFCASFAALAIICGCASGQSRQGTVEVTSDATIATVADVRAEAAAIKLVVSDESKRITETTQKAVVAVSRVDNSTSDKWVNRTLAIGAVLSYVIGKAGWLIAGSLHKKVKGA